MEDKKYLSELALVFATIDRPNAVQRLINSVHHFYPEMKIYVADQSCPSEYMKEYYRDMSVNITWMPHDAGVGASRNAAVKKVKEQYFLLCDDDFIFIPETKFENALKILNQKGDISVVGGKLIDVDHKLNYERRSHRYWELFFEYDIKNKFLLTVPIEKFSPRSDYCEGISFYHCDAVMNFSIFRRSIFNETIKWDEQFKSNGEHKDFYLNMKMNSHCQVVYLPSMVAEHNHPILNNYSELRNRSLGWYLFMKKWGLEQHLELGLGLRTIANVEKVLKEDFKRSHFFTSQNLAINKGVWQMESALEIQSERGVFAYPHYNATGEENYKEDPKFCLVEDLHKSKSGQFIDENPNSVEEIDKENVESVVDLKAESFFSKHSPLVKAGSELLIYVYSSCDIDLDGRFRLVYSVKKDSQFLEYFKEVPFYNQKFLKNQWNAVMLPMPKFLDELTFDLGIIDKQSDIGFHLLSGDVLLVPSYQSIEDSWVSSWTAIKEEAQLRLLSNKSDESLDIKIDENLFVEIDKNSFFILEIPIQENVREFSHVLLNIDNVVVNQTPFFKRSINIIGFDKKLKYLLSLDYFESVPLGGEVVFFNQEGQNKAVMSKKLYVSFDLKHELGDRA